MSALSPRRRMHEHFRKAEALHLAWLQRRVEMEKKGAPVATAAGAGERTIRAWLQAAGLLVEIIDFARQDDPEAERIVDAIGPMVRFVETRASGALPDTPAALADLADDLAEVTAMGEELADILSRTVFVRADMAQAERVETCVMEFVGRAIIERGRIGRHLAGPAPKLETKLEREAARVREYRERQSRGVHQSVRLDVYDGDIELLRRYGFFPERSGRTASAVKAALEDFIFVSLLSRPAQDVTFKQRSDEMQGRMETYLAPFAEDGK